MRKWFISFFLLVIVYSVSSDKSAAQQSLPTEQAVIESADGVLYPFQLEMAVTSKQREIGLMNRTSLPQNAGMMFVFPAVAIQSFWMKNTLIPLDLLFVSEQGVISHIHHEARPHDKTIISSPEPVKAVIEINGGLADKLNIQTGGRVNHRLFVP